MTEWRQPHVGLPPARVDEKGDTPPHGMVRVMGARLPPPLPVRRPPTTLPGMPAPPHVPVPVPSENAEDEITEPAGSAYRERCLVEGFRALDEIAKRRVERHIAALHSVRKNT